MAPCGTVPDDLAIRFDKQVILRGDSERDFDLLLSCSYVDTDYQANQFSTQTRVTDGDFQRHLPEAIDDLRRQIAAHLESRGTLLAAIGNQLAELYSVE